MKITIILLAHLFLINAAYCADFDDSDDFKNLFSLLQDDPSDVVVGVGVGSGMQEEPPQTKERNASIVSLESVEPSGAHDPGKNQSRKKKRGLPQNVRNLTQKEKQEAKRLRILQEKEKAENIRKAEYSAYDIVINGTFAPSDANPSERDLIIMYRSIQLSSNTNNTYMHIPVHLDYAYGIYYIRTGGSPNDFLELMKNNKVETDNGHPDLVQSLAHYRRKRPKRLDENGSVKDMYIADWLGLFKGKKYTVVQKNRNLI